MKKSRFLMIIALLLVSALTLSSCGVIIINDTSDPSDTTTPPETTAPPAADTTTGERIDKSPTIEYLDLAKQYLEALGEIDLGERDVIVAGVGAAKLGGVEDSMAGTIMGLNLGKRNTAFEEATNSTLIFEEMVDDLLYDEIIESVRADEYYADLLVIPQQYLGKFVVDGALFDITKLECDYSQPYFDYTAMEKTGGNQLYGLIGDATNDPDYLYATFFNKDIIKNAGLDSPYALVNRGMWNLDKFIEYTETVKNSEHGIDGFKHHGFMGSNYADVFFFAGNNSLMTNAAGNAPVLTTPTDMAEALVTKIRNMTKSSTGFTYGNSSEKAVEIETEFSEGKMLFYTATLERSSAFASIKSDWGIVPVPKPEVTQTSFRTLASPDMPVLAVPANTKNVKETSQIVSALFASSHKFLESAYAESQMTYFLRDSTAIDMVYRITKTAVYDMGHMYSTSFAGDLLPNVKNGTTTTLRTVVSKGGTMSHYYNLYYRRAASELSFLAPAAE